MTGFHLRPVAADDDAAIAEVLNRPEVIAGTLRLPFTAEFGLQEWLRECGPDIRMVIAEAAGRAVGFVRLTRRKGRRGHCGEVFLVVHDDFHRRGIGRALMAAALDIADNWMGLVRVELDTFVTNRGALALYHSCGFEIEGRARAGTLVGGQLVDHYIMARLRPAPARRAEDEREAP